VRGWGEPWAHDHELYSRAPGVGSCHIRARHGSGGLRLVKGVYVAVSYVEVQRIKYILQYKLDRRIGPFLFCLKNIRFVSFS
jgi:hypothetical protein